ncbi:MAG: LLM class flavin-dependent oxidoreductase [Dehalococcoidia bacterium]|nr:LLM class flavin-dependent oxidoreductase [Dehalococcoidia bacterium]
MLFSTFHFAQLAAHQTAPAVLDAIVADAVLAEELGFDACWVAEHHFSPYGIVGAPTLLMAAIAMRTRAIKIGSAVAVMPFHHPLRLAEDFALIDNLSNGRVVAGIGPGFAPVEFAGFGQPVEQRRDRFLEGVELLQRAWEEPVVNFHGVYYRANNVTVYPRVVQQPRPLIVQAATKVESRATAARLGRPILIGRLGFDDARDAIAHYVFTRREAGHEELAIVRALDWCGVLRHVCVAETESEARRLALRASEVYLPMAAGLGLPPAIAADTEEPESFLARGAIVGTPEHVADQIAALFRIGVRHLICAFDWGGMDRGAVHQSMHLLAERVMPLFSRSAVVS